MSQGVEGREEERTVGVMIQRRGRAMVRGARGGWTEERVVRKCWREVVGVKCRRWIVQSGIVRIKICEVWKRIEEEEAEISRWWKDLVSEWDRVGSVNVTEQESFGGVVESGEATPHLDP